MRTAIWLCFEQWKFVSDIGVSHSMESENCNIQSNWPAFTLTLHRIHNITCIHIHQYAPASRQHSHQFTLFFPHPECVCKCNLIFILQCTQCTREPLNWLGWPKCIAITCSYTDTAHSQKARGIATEKQQKIKASGVQAKVNHTNPSTNKMHSVLSPKILHKNVNGLSVDCRKADGWGYGESLILSARPQ